VQGLRCLVGCANPAHRVNQSEEAFDDLLVRILAYGYANRPLQRKMGSAVVREAEGGGRPVIDERAFAGECGE